MSNFKVGEKVVAKDLSSQRLGTPFGIVLGEIYEIEGMYNCNCGIMLLIKNVDSGSLKSCGCRNGNPTNSFHSWRFRKLDHAHTERICAEIIESLKVEEVQLN